MSNYELHLAVQFLEEKSLLIGNCWNQINSYMRKKADFYRLFTFRKLYSRVQIYLQHSVTLDHSSYF